MDLPDSLARLHREIAVARHLAERSAPIVRPATALPAGPHLHDGFGLTFWQFLDHVAADENNGKHIAGAARALRRVHAGLADFPGELPSFRIKIDECRALLDDESALRALPAADRSFLTKVHDRIGGVVDAADFEAVPIHGDAHLGNVLIASDGAYWNDFEDVCMGPREWDIGWLRDADLRAFEPVNRDLLSVLSDLRSWCVSIWCWAKFDVPEKREAAEYHLQRLRRRFE